MIETVYVVRCNRCGTQGPIAPTEHDAQKMAIEQGFWLGKVEDLEPLIHLCDACVERGKLIAYLNSRSCEVDVRLKECDCWQRLDSELTGFYTEEQ